VTTVLVWYSTPIKYVMMKNRVEKPVSGASEMEFMWEFEGYQTKALPLKYRYRFGGATFDLLWEDYRARYAGKLSARAVPSSYLLPSKVTISQPTQIVKGVFHCLLDDFEMTEEGAVGDDSHVHWFLKYPVADKDKPYLHAYKNALGFFPRFRTSKVDVESAGWRAKSPSSSPASPPAAQSPSVGSISGSGSDSESEKGDNCDDETDGGKAAFDAKYIAQLDDCEVFLIESNQYDMRHLDTIVRFEEGLDEEGQRKAVVDATLKEIKRQLRQQEKLAQVR